jgi:hypothetical protein
MSDNGSANFPLLVSREHAENAYGDALRLFVGRGRRYSVKQLANGTGVKDRAIECAMCRSGSADYRPLHLGAMLSITRFLGAEFTNEWLSLADQVAHDLPGDEPDPGELAADTSEDTAKVVRMAADRDLTNDDPNQLRETGTRMMTRGAQLVSLSGRARKRA